MFKAVVEKERLLKVLNLVQAVADKKTSMAVLSTVLVEAEGGGLRFSATDLEMGFRGKVEAELEGEEAFCLPARKLYEIVKNFPQETLVIEKRDGETVEIRDLDQEISYNLSFFPAEDFPALPEIVEETVIEIPGETLEDMLERTLYAAAAEEARYALCGVFFTRAEDQFRMVATDGHRLALVDREVPGVEALPLGEGVIVPRKAAQELRRLAAEEMLIRLGVRENHLVASSSQGILLARLLEGQFPDYRAVIPQESGRKVLFDRERLIESLKRVSLLSSDRYRVVRFEFSPGQAFLIGSGGELGEARERVPAAYEGEPFAINFNARYLLDTLQVMDSAEVELDIGSERTPCRVTGPEDEGYLALIMPMIL
ncbi:MAG: DNA polymerase III subunit beta [Thermodesulfatator sp.]|nr:MAG: DNA polymerase III subunit beta [Thermodesulfatator sp.]